MEEKQPNPYKPVFITILILAIITGGLLFYANVISTEQKPEERPNAVGTSGMTEAPGAIEIQGESSSSELTYAPEQTDTPKVTINPTLTEGAEVAITPPTEEPDVTLTTDTMPTPEATSTPDTIPTPDTTLTPEITPASEPNKVPETTSVPNPTQILEVTPTPFPTPSTVAEIASLVPDFASDTVTLCLAGDLMCLAGQQFSAAVKGGGHDYTGSYAFIRDYLEAHDLAIGNLETLLSPSNPYSTAAKTVNDQPNCNAPADYLASVKFAGFDALVTANNHCLDGGAVGVKETIENLDSYGFPHVGTYNGSKKNKHYILLQAKEMTIGLISVTELVNQRASVSADELPNYVDTYDEKFITEQIQNAREAGADFIVVYEHWGSENTHEVRDYQKSHAKFIANAGADLIIGSHPHCLQPYTVIKTEDGRNVPCIYSMGNLVSSMTRDINHDTLLLSVAIRKSGEAVEIDQISALPCHVLESHNGAARVIMPISYKLADQKKTNELNEAFGRISELYPEFFLEQ